MSKKLELGIQIDANAGVAYFGFEEINRLIAQGARVTAIEPGGVVMYKDESDEDNVTLTLGGYKLNVVIESNGGS